MFANQSTRRAFVAGLFVAGLLLESGCATPVTPPNPTPVVTPLAQIQNWVQIFDQELPAFISDLQVAGTLTGKNLVTANTYVVRFQSLATTFLQLPAGTTPQQVLNDISALLVQILAVIPQAAPFIPLVILFQAAITAFLASQPVTAPPTTAALANAHASTRAMHSTGPTQLNPTRRTSTPSSTRVTHQ